MLEALQSPADAWSRLLEGLRDRGAFLKARFQVTVRRSIMRRMIFWARWSGIGMTLAVLATACRGGGEKLEVWAVNDGEKVLRGALDHRSKAKNSVWNGKEITLVGSRNEIVGFQVIVNAPTEAVS